MSKVIGEFNLSEICLSLETEDKKRRLRSLEKLRTILNDEEKQRSKQEISEIWQGVNKHIAKTLTDPAEACRDIAVDITKMFIRLLPIVEANIMYLVPVLVRRLSSQEIQEPAEEVRLNCISLIRVIINLYNEHMSVYINDFLPILSRTVTDNYPKVKKESCEAIAELAQTASAQFYSICDGVIKPILSNFTHQHYRVRVASVKAIGQVIQYGHSKHMEDVATPLAERLFDQSGAVRAAVIEVAGNWLLNLNDRYSWWYKLLPLLLTGLHDEINDIRVTAGKFWDNAGQQYLMENEHDQKVKDKMDFLTDEKDHYPSNIKRPNLGCRLIVQLNICKLVGAISHELGDWLADIRVRSAQLLAVFTLHAEENITQHFEKLLPSMYRACNDEEDIRVVENVILAAEYMGYFVPPQTYCRLILPVLEDGNIKAGHLAVFAAILRGSKGDDLVDKLQEIGNFLRQSHICQSKQVKYQYHLLQCCEALLNICQEDCKLIVEDLFVTIVIVWSMAQDDSHKIFAKQLMETLSTVAGLKDYTELYDCYLSQIFSLLEDTSNTWSAYSPEIYIFKFCLTEARLATANNLNLIIPILKIILHINGDVELRLKTFIMLSDFFQHCNAILNDTNGISDFVLEFFDILIPALIWSAGKTAEAIRTAAIGCFCAFFDVPNCNVNEDEQRSRFSQLKNTDEERMKKYFPNESHFGKWLNQLKPILVSLINDNARKTRLYAIRALCITVNIGINLFCITDEDVIEIYPVVIKRLDDGSDDVRCAAIEALVYIWRALSKDYNLEFGRSHIDYLYTTLIIHLDDPERYFQDLVLDALMELTVIHPKMLVEKMSKSKGNFRNQKGLDELLNHCHKLLKAGN